VKALSFTDSWLDGELVYIGDGGITHFNRPQAAIGHGNSHLNYFAFDAPWLNGRDLRRTTLTLRYDALKIARRWARWHRVAIE
jgi:bifunctional non-homologous end joining protein LigD